MNWDKGIHTTTQVGGQRHIDFILSEPIAQECYEDGWGQSGWEHRVNTEAIPCPTISPKMSSAALKSQDFIIASSVLEIGWSTLAALFSFLVLHTSTCPTSLPATKILLAGRRRRD